MADFSIDFVPDLRALSADYGGVVDRCKDLRPGWEKAMDLLEWSHRRHFARLASQPEPYVRTGRLKASLTQRTAPYAVRKMSKHGMVFGSRLPYAAGLTMAPTDPNSGQVKKRPPGSGKYAVLVFSATTRSLISLEMVNYIKGDFGNVGP